MYNTSYINYLCNCTSANIACRKYKYFERGENKSYVVSKKPFILLCFRLTNLVATGAMYFELLLLTRILVTSS